MIKMKRITVLGNFSGRNAGDNAILGNLLNDFHSKISDVVFLIPTLNRQFIIESFGHYPVRPVSLMPWNLTLRNFGWPMFKAMTDTDLILITDNILFDRKFNNPLVNYLKSIAFFSGFAKKKTIPIVPYNASIGPINTRDGAKALQKALDACPLVISRDYQAVELIENLRLKCPTIIFGADSALNTMPVSNERLGEITEKFDLFRNPNGTIGLNVNSYLNNWNKKGSLNKDDFCKTIASTADQLINKLHVNVLFVVTQIMDESITRECIKIMKNQSRVKLVSNKHLNFRELATLLGKVDVHAGMRTHTLIFSAAMGTPMISINTYPKSAAFMKTIGMDDWTINVDEISKERLFQIIELAWHNRSETGEKMNPLVSLEKKKARENVAKVISIMNG